jgi:hypothetical protein
MKLFKVMKWLVVGTAILLGVGLGAVSRQGNTMGENFQELVSKVPQVNKQTAQKPYEAAVSHVVHQMRGLFSRK